MGLLHRDSGGSPTVEETGLAEERAAYLDRICRILWPEPAHVCFTRAGRHCSDSSPSRQAPGSAGHTVELIVLPSHVRPRLLIPTERRAAAAAIRRYGEPGSRTSTLRKQMVWLATISTAAPRLFRDRLVINAPPGLETLVTYLQAALGREMRISMYVSGARANRKPVLQLLTPDGDAIGFAKVGIDPLTCRLVRAEGAGLDLVAAASPRSLTAPRVLHCGTWNGLDVLVLSPLPVWQRRRAVSRLRLQEAMREIAGIAGVRREGVTASTHLQRLRDRLSSAPEGDERAALQSLLRMLAQQGEEVVLSYGSWHGDWSPWNMASTRTRLLVWDWERFSTMVPVGFDALHYWVQTEIGPRHRKPAAVAAEVVDRAASLLGVFGIAAREIRFTALLYLAELAVRDLVDRQEEAGSWVGGPGRWLIPAMTSELAR